MQSDGLANNLSVHTVDKPSKCKICLK